MKYIKGNLTYGFVIALIAMQFSYTEAAIKCVQCNGSGCDVNIKNLIATDCEAHLDAATNCFTKIDTSGIITRGCLALDDANCTVENNCAKTDPEKNTQLLCKTCTGTDAECSQTDMTDNTVKFMKICDAGIAQCISNVKDKKVIRGCATAADVTACTDATTCKVCDNIFCNTGIFPTARISCYQCSDSTCNDVTTASVKSKPCLDFVADDKCYTKGESATTMKRGCQSDVGSSKTSNECLAVKDGCLFCGDQNCNNLKHTTGQKLKCHQCTGSATAKDCFNEQTGTDFKDCENEIQFNQVGYCYTNLVGDTIQRGCLYDNSEIMLETCINDCTTCSDKDGCNNEKVSTEISCINCRSDDTPTCWNEATLMTGSKCRTGDSSYADGCFHGIWNGVAIRGCYVDGDERQQYVCRDPSNNQCHVCHTKDCNKEISSNGASTISMYFGLWFMILITLWQTYFK